MKTRIITECEKTLKKKKRLQHLLDLENQNEQLTHYLIFASLLALREMKAEDKEKKKPDLVPQLSVNLRNNIKRRSDWTKEHDIDWLRHREESLPLLFDFERIDEEETSVYCSRRWDLFSCMQMNWSGFLTTRSSKDQELISLQFWSEFHWKDVTLNETMNWQTDLCIEFYTRTNERTMTSGLKDSISITD